MLRDRNTVRMIADHWGCSVSTVHRRIADGSLPCLRIGGIVRLSREQVEAYEQQCSSGSTPTASGTFSTAPASGSALALALQTAKRQKFSSPNSSQPKAP